MKVRVHAEGRSFSVTCPLGLARFVVRCIPQRVFDKMVEQETEDDPESKGGMPFPLDKSFVLEMLDEVRDISREFKGLEIVHVQSAGGDEVSISL